MSPSRTPDLPPRFILPNVEPLLSELTEPVTAGLLPVGAADRSSADAFVRAVFAEAYAADVCSSYPTLLTFRDGRGERAVVGLRDAASAPLFAEQYLDGTIGDALRAGVGVAPPRALLMEVGNLALRSVGDARWVIAATTLFLHARGYRFAIFTATRMLQNAFQRLGLQPAVLGDADPERLRDGGGEWGAYYRTRPVVCAGHVPSGYCKLVAHPLHHQPHLRALLDDVRRLAGASRRAVCGDGDA